MTNAESGADRGLLEESSTVAKPIDNGAPRAHTASTAQVAPLPRVDDFHVGHIIAGGDGALASTAKAAHETEESYIPVALAREHLARVVQDMHAMKQDQTAKMTQIVDRYKTIEAETKAYYESYISELKRKAKDKFRVEQARFSALEAEQRETQQLAREEIHGIYVVNDHQQRRHEQQKARWREEVETAFVRYEEELTRLHARVENEIQIALARQAEIMGGTHKAEVERLQKSWDDAKDESARVVEQTKLELTEQLTETEAKYETRIRGLKWEADVALETFKCLATVVNRVVDMETQTKRRKRSRELQGEIAALGRQAQAAAATERALATQLSALKAQYDAMEQRAVRQAMDMMLRTVELMPVEAHSDPVPFQLPEPVTVHTPEPLSGSLRPPVVESEAQTTDWAALLAAHSPPAIVQEVPPQKPPVETRDAAVETETDAQDPPKPELSALTLPSATQLQYEADAERFRERNAELLQSKNALKAVKADLQVCLERKNDAKTRIKQWLADFQQQHARDPTIEEKAQVKDLYLAFKVSEEAYNAAKVRVADAKARHHERVVEIEALSQWHALAASARGSSRGGESETSGRPGTAASLAALPMEGDDASSSPPATIEPTAAARLAEADKLAKEIDELRAELKVAHAEKKKSHDDIQRAMLEAKQARADAKEAADRLAMVEAKALEAATQSTLQQSIPAQAKAEEKETGKQQEDDQQQGQDQGDAELRQHQERLETYARESQALDSERAELQASIASLRDEIAARASEKQALETQIEQLRLHAELMDGHDGEDEDATLRLLGSEAKVSRRASAKGEEDEEEAGSGEEGEEEKEEEVNEAHSLSPLKSAISETDRADGVKEAQLITQIKEAIEAGKTQWNRGDKAKCFQLYVKMCEKCVEVLRSTGPPGRREEVAALKAALLEAGRLPPAKGSMVLRRQLDNCLAACEARAKQLVVAEELEMTAAMSKTSTPATSPQRKTPHKKSVAPSSFPSEDEKSATTPVAGKGVEEARQKIKALETKAKADKVRITQLEASLAKAETQLLNATSSSGGGGGANTAVLERKLAEAEKKHTKALDEAEKTLKKELAALSQQLGASQSKSQTLQEQVDKLTKELSVAGGKATQLSKMEEEVTALRAKAAQVDALGQELSASKGELTKLEASYKEEQALRKKYYNMIEDMKGKIRVYARCRPMSSSETERGCDTSVRFVDEFSLELKTSHGPKTFAYDQVFTPASTQDQVFEDTKNLLQSALDGYNVCIFAYGQTGSGKTFTMTGSESMPGLSPRAIHHLFKLAEENQGNHTITFQAFMLELYNDNLIDLFHLVDGGGQDAPKLDIKKNDRGMVFVSNITTKSCTSAQQTLKLFDAANKKRQVGATKMNAESSRSHSVFSLLVENYNKTTKTTSIGKLSLVDLAGSERAGKTGATNDRLKEAQAINKSLSALGDVIAALSAGEKFIPYRNNKLTQLMQDSLGGNAKTLMFVNISPADYNQEETQTSLQYASRVKLITNNANKTSESETVNRLKHIIKQLRAGKSEVELDGLGIE